MSGAPLVLWAFLGCDLPFDGPEQDMVVEAESERSPGVLWITLEDAPASRFTAWGGTDDRLEPFTTLGTTWLRAYAPTPQRQPNLATLFTGEDPSSHGVWLDGMQRLPDHVDTVFEQLSREGWHTSASSGTLLTDDRWGLHQGVRAAAVHDDVLPNPLPAASVVERLDRRDEPEVAWVHLPADGLGVLPDLLGDWVELHPEGWVVVAGVHGRGSGLVLDDDAVRLPLVVVGPGFDAGVTIDDVVGLRDVAPTVRALLGMVPRGVPLQAGGSDVVFHWAHQGRALFGTEVLSGSTDTDGRVVTGGPPRYYGALGTRIPTSGHFVPDDHGAVTRHRERLAAATTDVAPAALVPLVERLRLTQVAPHTLGDPDTPPGPLDPHDAEGRLTMLEEAARPIRWKQWARVEHVAEPLGNTPAGALLATLAARGRADAGGAAAALEARLAAGGGPVFSFHRAEVALDRCHVENVSSWLAPMVVGTSPPSAGLARLVHRARAYGPLPDDLAELSDLLVTTSPHDPFVAALSDPAAITQLPVRPGSPVTGLIRAQADWQQGHAGEAIDTLREAVALDPMDCTLRVALARWYLEGEDHIAAQRLLAPLVRSNPDDPVLEALQAEAVITGDERYERQLDRTYNRP